MMANRTRLLVIVAVLAVGAVALVVGLGQSGARPTPATTTPGATVTAAFGALTAEPGTTVYTPEPTPTLTRAEEVAQEIAQSGGQFTSSADACGQILQTEDWCGVIRGGVRIARPEWEELFPHTEFYAVKRDLYGGEFVQQRNMLIVEQDGERYTVETFDRLLAANGITEITDENRELVARALVLMTLPDYLEEEIVFTDWIEGNWPARFGKHFNYSLKVWTKIQGLRTQWFFAFENDHLRLVRRMEAEHHVGDYIDVPLEALTPPGFGEFFFQER